MTNPKFLLPLRPCPLCQTTFDSRHSIHDHLSEAHSFAQLRTVKAEVALYFDLHLCEQCQNGTPKICSQKRGLTQHVNASHKPTARSKVNPRLYNDSNISTIRNVFRIADSETSVWPDTLRWLLTLTPYPPSFRVSLYSKLSSELRTQVSLIFLNWLLVIYRATTSTDFDHSALPTHNSSSDPLLKVFFLFEALILAPPGENEHRKYKKCIPERLRLFRLGYLQPLYQNAFCRKMPPQSNNRPLDHHIAHSVEQAIRNGDYRNAVQRLNPQPRALLTEQNLAILKRLHPPPVQDNRSSPVLPPCLDVYGLSDFDQTLRHTTRGLAPGFLADSQDLLMFCGDRYPPGEKISGAQLLAHVLSLFLANHVSPLMWQYFRDNYVMCLHKDFLHHPEKLRPIGIGTAFRRISNRHILRKFSESIARIFTKAHQFALGLSGGTEFITGALAYAIQTLLVDTPYYPSHQMPYVLLKLDFTNMFNSVSRKVTRNELLAHPELADLTYLYDHLYPAQGNTVWAQLPNGSWFSFLQEEGHAQGDPFGPFFSCLPLLRLLIQLESALQQRHQERRQDLDQLYAAHLAYMDDVHDLSRMDDVAFTFDFLNTHGPPYGLNLSHDKNQILLATSGPSTWDKVPLNLQQQITTAANTYCRGEISFDGLTILGSPIGNPQFVRDQLALRLVDFQTQLALVYKCLAHSPQAQFHLFYHCLQRRYQFLQYADGLLPDTIFHNGLGTSPYISHLTELIKSFLRQLLATPNLPQECWELAVLFLQHGGLGIANPPLTALSQFIRPTLRFIRTAKHGFTGQTYFAPPPSDGELMQPPPLYPLTDSFPFLQFDPKSNPTWIAKLFSTLAETFPQHSRDTFLSKDFKVLPTIHNVISNISFERYQAALPMTSFRFRRTQQSLRSALTSVALTSLPLYVASHRLSPIFFVTAMRQKLSLPLLLQPQQCLCDKTMDIYGDHAFSCTFFNKTTMHHRLRDTLFYIFQKLAPLSGLCLTEADVVLEPKGLLPSLPTRRPADIAIRLLPDALPHTTHLLMDVTSVSFPADTKDSNPSSVFQHHQRQENRKFNGPSKHGTVIGDLPKALLRHRFSYLPLTFDPGGILGPASSGFLWSAQSRPSTQLSPSMPNSVPLANPYSSTLKSQTYNTVSKFALLSKANVAWRSSHGNTWFAPHYTTAAPAQWAYRTLAQNFLLATTRHLLVSLHKAAQPQAPKILHTASGIPPSIRNSIVLLPSKFDTLAPVYAGSIVH